MGKMRDSLNAMTVLIGAFEDRTEKLSEEIASLATNVQKTLERVYGGTELLYMYLTQKAKKEGTTIKAWAKDDLKDHFDSEVNSLMKGIEAARGDVITAFKKQEATVDIKLKGHLADIQRALVLAGELRTTLGKKKKKLLTSKKYKAKLAGYEKLLDGLEGTLKQSVKADAEAVQFAVSGNTKLIEKLKVTPATKISAIDMTSWLGIKKELDGIAAVDGKQLAKKFKRYGNEIKQLREWVGEADEMEAEASE
jgi:hypothetical protein